MNESKQKQLIEKGNFKDNNGAIMRLFNMAAYKFYKIKEIMYALPYISKEDVLKGMDYLSGEGYVIVRNILTREVADISDNSYDELEAKLSTKGMKLLECAITDPLVDL